MRNYQFGLMLNMLCTGLLVATAMCLVMTPDFPKSNFDLYLGIGVIALLVIGIGIGALILDRIGKVLKTVDRWETAYGNVMPRDYVGSPECIDEEKAKALLSALPDWRT